MPPKQTTAAGSRSGFKPPLRKSATPSGSGGGSTSRTTAGGRGGRAGAGSRSRAEPEDLEEEDRGRDGGRIDNGEGEGEEDEEAVEGEKPKSIPPELLTRLLHEFFENDTTRITKDANAALAKYMDVFTREAIARAAVEKEGGFLEVEDLEKIAPQLLLDL